MPTMVEARDDLIGIYKRAVKRHLLSDVPVGLLLSGGVDSGMLLGLMNLFGKDWPTFTIGYGQSFKDDEIKDAAETARILHSRHAPILIDRDTFEKALPRIVNCLEEPIASSSIVPMYFLCERARQDVKVVLNGQGPDELFGGYIRHLGVKYGKYWRSVPVWLQSPLTAVVHALPRNESLKRGVNSLNTQDRIRRYQKVFSIVPEETIDSLFLDGLLPRDAGDAILKCWQDLVPLMENTDELGGLQFIEIRSSLPDELLMYADKLSMAHGLEVRIPYLDREIVEYVEQLDASFKVSYGIRKWLHRKICQDYLTAEIIKRKKRGFGVNVVDDWFSNSLKSSLDSFLTDEKSLMYQFLRPKSVQRLYQDHLSRKNDNHKLLFSLVVFEQWLKSANI
jgi:asparagine synthase (glutamine-hydrolysing)